MASRSECRRAVSSIEDTNLAVTAMRRLSSGREAGRRGGIRRPSGDMSQTNVPDISNISQSLDEVEGRMAPRSGPETKSKDI